MALCGYPGRIINGFHLPENLGIKDKIDEWVQESRRGKYRKAMIHNLYIIFNGWYIRGQ